ncbi:MAG TPA: UDP-glucose 6-dehydrogenase, partial [Parachlamydiales bacterium]|nr:UDP-glucose 6-dehydrogenase [Parachlamydiales bacterium]
MICLDIDNEKIERLLKKETPFFEPGLDELVKRNLQAGRLHFTTDYKKGVAKSEILLLALPTPSRPDGSCNLDPLTSAVDAIAPLLDGYRLIVNKST